MALASVTIVGAAAAVALLAKGCGPPPPSTVAAPPAVLVPPLHDAQVGEELRMRRGAEEWLWRVVSATDDEVAVDFFITRGGIVDESGTEHLRWRRNSFGIPDGPEGYVIREIRRDRIDVGGRSHDCWRIKAYARDAVRYYWITDALNVSGFLRIALDDRGRPLMQTAADAVLDK